MRSQDDFVDIIDQLVPAHIQQTINDEITAYSENNIDCGFMELINWQEKGRVLTIKEHISSTHDWCRAHSLDAENHQKEIFLCVNCGIRASVYEHINAISIISKVQDDLPTYTVHNQYLMYTCEDIKEMFLTQYDLKCIDCGIPEQEKTSFCDIV